uniref:Putative gamma-coatomer protein n=1 Tax=Ixodes ricinus TaxID=34613 RepID=A0A0K8RL90_IXORI
MYVLKRRKKGRRRRWYESFLQPTRKRWFFKRLAPSTRRPSIHGNVQRFSQRSSTSLNQGEALGTTEATEAFFAMTKLFQCRDTVLRRLVYLGIKELSKVAEDVIIVTSSLTKDMTGKEDLYRAAAIRALCKITDSSMLQAIERYMKQAIVDKN